MTTLRNAWFYSVLLVPVLAACEPTVEPPPPPAEVPVTSEEVRAMPFEPRLLLLGKVEPAARIELRAREAGTLRYPKRFADGLRTGEAVRRGEPLFHLDNPQLKLQLTEARLAARAATAELERARTGVEGGFLPGVEVERREIEKELAEEQLAAVEQRVQRSTHDAPSTGVLEIEEILPAGSEVSEGALVGHLATAGAPRVEAWASASDLDHLRPGLRAECLEPRGRQPVGRGVVREVARQIGATGTVRVVVEVEENLALPPSGQGVEVEVLLERREAALTVPIEAVLMVGGAHKAFVLLPSGEVSRVEARRLQVGRRSAGRLEVLGGLSVGERVVVRGAELLTDGQRVVETGENGMVGEARGTTNAR